MQSFKKRSVMVLGFLLIFGLYTLLILRNEYLQFLEIGEKYANVFITDMKYKYLTMAVNFVVLFLSFYITTKLIKKGLKKFFEDEKKEMPKLPNKSISFIIGLIISIFSTNQIYDKVILLLNGAWFGINDPIFNRDIGFYMFIRPFIWTIVIYWLLLIVVLVIYTVAYYIVVFNKFFDGVERETLKSNMFIKQLLCSLFLVSLGVSGVLILKSQDILFERFGTSIYGAGFTSITVKLWRI